LEDYKTGVPADQVYFSPAGSANKNVAPLPNSLFTQTLPR
jgi:hypothetical protein